MYCFMGLSLYLYLTPVKETIYKTKIVVKEKECPILIPKIITVAEPCPEFSPCPETNFDLEDCKKRYWWLFSDNDE